LDTLPDIVRIQNDFLSSKLCCCVLPLSYCGTESQMRSEFKSCPDKMNVGGLALDSTTGAALGFCQLVFNGMPDELHRPRADECYIASLAVLPEARGKGVGTKLLQWAEEVARARGASIMTLGVINGNPASGLYERFGFSIYKESLAAKCNQCCMITFCFGRPYGMCHPRWGGASMEKPLVEGVSMTLPMQAASVSPMERS
jgi:ribosomal protein S18 acetylase RimI-like enzyme